VNVAGSPEKDYVVEASGNGAAFFDYDNDGLLDVLIVNGSTLEVLERTAAIRWWRCTGTAAEAVSPTSPSRQG
jgi:hypothetical protein